MPGKCWRITEVICPIRPPFQSSCIQVFDSVHRLAYLPGALDRQTDAGGDASEEELMRSSLITSCMLLALMGVASAQQVSNSTSASASTNNSVSADKSGANVQSDNQANVSSQTNVSAPRTETHHKSTKDRDTPQKEKNGSAGASNSLVAGTTIDAVLSKPLDSRKCKPGDQVIATASKDVKSDGKVVVRKGSRLIGHVTEAKAKGSGEASSVLGIAFDRAVLKDGQQVQMNSVVQAIAAARGPAEPSNDDDAVASATPMAGGAVRSGGGLLGGTSSAVSSTTGAVGSVGGDATGTVSSTVGSTANIGNGVNGAFGSATTGVVGLQGLSLATDATNATASSVITSTGKSVHLDSGTQLLLRVAK